MKTTALHVVKPEAEAPKAQRQPATSKLWKDKGWKYVRSESTDIGRTFARIRREQAAAAKKEKRR